MTAILKEDVPELASSGRQIPQPLERIVRRCLEKNPHERMQLAVTASVTGTSVLQLAGDLFLINGALR